jgi:hypothetical protein
VSPATDDASLQDVRLARGLARKTKTRTRRRSPSARDCEWLRGPDLNRRPSGYERNGRPKDSACLDAAERQVVPKDGPTLPGATIWTNPNYKLESREVALARALLRSVDSNVVQAVAASASADTVLELAERVLALQDQRLLGVG